MIQVGRMLDVKVIGEADAVDRVGREQLRHHADSPRLCISSGAA